MQEGRGGSLSGGELTNTGWERKVHVTPSVDLYSGQILVRSMSGKFQSVYFSDLIIFTLRISASYQ